MKRRRKSPGRLTFALRRPIAFEGGEKEEEEKKEGDCEKMFARLAYHIRAVAEMGREREKKKKI